MQEGSIINFGLLGVGISIGFLVGLAVSYGVQVDKKGSFGNYVKKCVDEFNKEVNLEINKIKRGVEYCGNN